MNKIGRPRSRSPIYLIRSIITDRIGRQEGLLPFNHHLNKICDILGSFEIKTQQNLKIFLASGKKKTFSKSARDGAYCPSCVYSYFENGCRKKCTLQSRKALWVVLRALFFKEIWKNATGGNGHMFASTKGKQQNYRFDSLSRYEQCIDHIPYYLSGLSRALFFRQPFSKQL